MNFIKRTINRALHRFGYRLAPLDSEPPREAANLRHLAVAYEYLLNAESPRHSLAANDVRLSLLGRLLGSPPPEAYAIAQALSRTAGIDGDVCEFGVAQGETSAFIANEILLSHRRLHLFDSFEGLPPPTVKDVLKDDIFSLGSIDAYTGTMACPEDLVVNRLAAVGFPMDRYIIHRGFVESVISIDDDLPDRVSFAYVDFDFYEPIKVTLDFLEGVVPVGGEIIVDDYDFFSTGSKTAVDEFVDRVGGSATGFKLTVPDPRLGHFAILTRNGG